MFTFKRGHPGGGNGNPFQYSCLENSTDSGAWQAVVHEVAKNWIRMSTHTHTPESRVLSERITLLMAEFLSQGQNG